MKKTIGVVVVIFLMLFSAVSGVLPAKAAEIKGVYFEQSVIVSQEELKLRGVALLKYLFVINAYVGALYLQETVASEDLFSDIPKQLVLEYFHPIEAEDFYSATRTMIEKNTDPETLSIIKGELAHLKKIYRDVKPHDRYTLTYLPGHGTELALNGVVLGTFKSMAFSRAMFSIWLGDSPIDKDFSDRLKGMK